MTKIKSKRRNFLVRIGALLSTTILATPLLAKSDKESKGKTEDRTMSDPFIGEIKMFAGNYAPTGYEFCNGQLLQITQNFALFSLLGTIYGGDGQTTFGLPDLRARLPMHAGNGSSNGGLSNRSLGQKGGAETVVLSTTELPSHNHTASTTGTINVGVSEQSPNTEEAEGTVLSKTNGALVFSDTGATAGQNLGGVSHSLATTVNNNGSSQAHENMPPFLAIHYIIATAGTFPPSN